MQVTTLHMPKDVARAKLKAIRTSLHKRADEGYQDLEKVYSALAEGTPILDLAETFRNAYVFDDWLPKLAIARADRKRCRARRWRTSIEFATNVNMASRPSSLCIEIEGLPDKGMGGPSNGSTLVPGIPPEVRERMKGRVRDHFILWEVEEWTPEPDRDPMLLKHLGGDYYAIVDHWELTDLEADILSGRGNK